MHMESARHTAFDLMLWAVNSRYDQMLFEDETQNRMMETKELFDWVLKQRCFEVSRRPSQFACSPLLFFPISNPT
jgi:hypothetical protein